MAEISSNSGHTSPHSHNDSDEWETMRGSVQRMNLSDTENSSTLKPTQQVMSVSPGVWSIA